ncbi:MAG: cation:proton antiporter [Actinomycetota bacterium]|jgi:Kef-type K+ transport system membrane component KefB
MTEVSFDGLLIVAVIAVAAPLAVATVPGLRRIPAVVVEILAGIAVGPAGFGWVEPDTAISVLGLVGLAFLLFLAGLELDLMRLRGPVLRSAGGGYLLTLALGLVVGAVAGAADVVRSPLLLAVTLSATSLGLVVPVLKDSGVTDSDVGRLTIAGATVADFAAIVLLSLFFSTGGSDGPAASLVLLGLLALLGAAVAAGLSRLGTTTGMEALLIRLQDTTAEIRVRFAVVLLVGFVTLASHLGLETILGAFVAGTVLNIVDRDSSSHPHFRLKLEAVGYGFVIPVFFVATGLQFDLRALLGSPSALARVPLFLLAFLLVRGVPALLYAPVVGRRQAMAAGLLQATTLPFVVTATAIGVALDLLTPVTAAALVAAGLASVIVFPLVALALLRGPSDVGAPIGGRRRPVATNATN